MFNEYAIYLRKSRIDLDAEARGEGDTLARHEKTLLCTAKAMQLSIGEIYREIISGDTIAERPEVQRLLYDVQHGKWAGVLVTDIDRLARGDTMDQGRVAQVFKFSDTKIITPLKTYDPNNEFDEEFFEFSLFMARREYKMITRRMQRGRIASVKEGNYVAGRAPYGYRRITDANGPTLELYEPEAEIIRYMYHAYTENGMSAYSIAKHLTTTGVPTRKGKAWAQETVRDIVSNPTYAGYIRWRKRVEIKTMSDLNNIKKGRRYGNEDEYMCIKGRHEPIISEELFNKTQEIIKKRYHWPISEKNRLVLKNPFAGIMKCKYCGYMMLLARQRNGALTVKCTHCSNLSTRIDILEGMVLKSLNDWLSEYTIAPQSENKNKNLTASFDVSKISETLSTLRRQQNSLYDLVEQGVYDKDTFLKRSKEIAEKISAAEHAIAAAKEKEAEQLARLKAQKNIIPTVEYVLSQYPQAATAEEKNKLLRSVIKQINYSHLSGEQVTLELLPLLPQ